jgi:copper chaperone CopZ
VEQVDVDVSDSVAQVRYDPAKVTTDAMIAAVKKAGFGASVLDG